ncbi:MAG: class I SAM-dependent methyltransferase [Deltaproteobacteria bacterium]|nr:class I SAM-dependent methyltransferase [Deltaproteobacteria bacterium]
MSTQQATVRSLDCGTSTGDVLARAAILDRHAPAADAATERSRRVWSAGDYDRISAGFRHEAEEFVARLALTPGQQVLDAACGSGNLTIPAARTGAEVTGLDLVPSLLERAASWAAAEGLAIRLHHGSVEELPYPDASFDGVLSMFGLMFAARPERVMAELTRVTRRGGRVALANWTREGFIGRLLATHVAYVPPPAGAVSPLTWGDEPVIRERFAASAWEVVTERRTLTFRYPHTPAGIAELFRGAYGPTVRTFEALDEDHRAWLAADLAEHWTRHHRPAVQFTEVDAEYLEVIATRR